MKYGLLLLLLLVSFWSYAQLVIDGKNINEDIEVEYIQLSFYFEGKKMSPVYSIDYGSLEDDNKSRPNKILIGKEEIRSQMTPVYVLNKLYKAGWEYVGDGMYMRTPIIENTQSYTLRRRKESK